MASIREIAQLAGVSPSTVSRVLNNPQYRCSSEEVRERIWRIAREQNYLPNEAARNLKLGIRPDTGPATRVDVLFTRSSPAQADPFFNELFRYVESEVHASHGIVARTWHETAFCGELAGRRAGAERLVARLLGDADEHHADGLIVLGRCDPAALELFSKRYRAVVAISRDPTGFAVDEVVCDGRRIAERAIGHLCELGHRHIGYAGRCQGGSLYLGYQEALARHGIALDPRAIMPCEHTETSGYEAMDALMQSDSAPSAIFCANDALAIGMIQRLAQGRRQYYRPSIIGVDDIEEGQFVRPMLTSIGMPKAEMARAAVQLLGDRIAGGHRSPMAVQFDCHLMERESCLAHSGPNSIEYII